MTPKKNETLKLLFGGFDMISLLLEDDRNPLELHQVDDLIIHEIEPLPVFGRQFHQVPGNENDLSEVTRYRKLNLLRIVSVDNHIPPKGSIVRRVRFCTFLKDDISVLIPDVFLEGVGGVNLVNRLICIRIVKF